MFCVPDGDGWTGETNYLISLISSLNYLKIKILIFRFLFITKKIIIKICK